MLHTNTHSDLKINWADAIDVCVVGSEHSTKYCSYEGACELETVTNEVPIDRNNKCLGLGFDNTNAFRNAVGLHNF